MMMKNWRFKNDSKPLENEVRTKCPQTNGQNVPIVLGQKVPLILELDKIRVYYSLTGTPDEDSLLYNQERELEK